MTKPSTSSIRRLKTLYSKEAADSDETFRSRFLKSYHPKYRRKHG